MKIAICILLVAATLAVYWPTQDHEFINYDDKEYITENWNVKSKLSQKSIAWAFTTSHAANWHPVTWLSHIVDYQFYRSNPKGHHLTNLFFHIANALLLFLILFRITGASWQSGFVATLFALHPFNVESVAWVAERKSVLSTFFWFLTMWAYIHYAKKPGIKRYGLVALFFALGLMSKPMLVTLPLVLLMMDYWPLRRLKFENDEGHNEVTEKYSDKKMDFWHLVWEKIPLFLLTTVSSIVTVVVQKSGGAVQNMEAYSLSARITNAMVSYIVYLKKAVWPKELALFYPHPGNSLAIWKGILCGMVLVGISAIAIKFIRKAPYFAFGWFWYLGTLAPVIGFVQVGGQAMADRYAYVPLIGIFIMVAWGVPELLAKWRNRDKVLVVLAGIYIPVLMILTWNQVSHWKNSISVFRHAIKVTDKEHPNFALVHANLGSALSAERKTAEAIFHFKKALHLEPNFTLAHNNLGNALFDAGKTDDAISHYKLAIKLKPDYAAAHNNLGIALSNSGKTDEAISHYKKAIKFKPEFAQPHYNLGLDLLTTGKAQEAISHFKIAITLNPDLTPAYNKLKTEILR
ncbi:MAG: tetratricopeptide repeat protein [Nitrospina sp.]|jgi:protein O-mannosyl-transferase|nr:tetratricopeptide repeat protein [Nitrospina sp.]MBT5631248.1 tetratricopeptide repeat protein [Nitrospina sp.]